MKAPTGHDKLSAGSGDGRSFSLLISFRDSMSGSQAVLGVLVLFASTIVFSQNNDTKPPESGVVTSTQTPAPTSADPCASQKQSQQAEILTDTMGVDFGPYLTNVVRMVRQNWYNVMPPSVYPPVFQQGKVAIEFVVQKDGTVNKMKIDTPSGDVALDRAAWASINGSAPFPSLPKEFPGQTLGLRFYFFYNLTPATARIYITPCVDVRVPVGSTLQFSVPAGGIERAAVAWSVSGPACEKAACGTISESGLYTAPAHVPNPPTVFVEATPESKRILPAKTKLTVVERTPSH
jgi:TonB family protein